jgi:hypothetical protein
VVALTWAPPPAGEQGGKGADAPGRAVDRDPLLGRESGVDEECLPGYERRERDRGRVDVVERSRLGGQICGPHGDVPSGAPVAREFHQAIGGVAGGDIRDAGAERLHDTRDVVTRDRGEAVVPVGALITLRPGQFRGREAGGVYPEERFARSRGEQR